MNTLSSILVIEDGILILNKDEHPLKAFFPIEFTDDKNNKNMISYILFDK